jgi:hypothetical protein
MRRRARRRQSDEEDLTGPTDHDKDQKDAGPKKPNPTTAVVNMADVMAMRLNCTPKLENKPRARFSSCL